MRSASHDVLTEEAVQESLGTPKTKTDGPTGWLQAPLNKIPTCRLDSKARTLDCCAAPRTCINHILLTTKTFGQLCQCTGHACIRKLNGCFGKLVFGNYRTIFGNWTVVFGNLSSETTELYSETGTIVFGNWHGCIRKLEGSRKLRRATPNIAWKRSKTTGS